MHTVKRLACDETVQRLDAEGKLAEGERTLHG